MLEMTQMNSGNSATNDHRGLQDAIYTEKSPISYATSSQDCYNTIFSIWNKKIATYDTVKNSK